ncbi:MAG TPA: hypothetical protein VNS08_17240 [Ureibacillus sp.]|nr:hypothetical protein [Ureibacillus sp.]
METSAAYSKVATTAAKKVVKEVAVNSAVEMAMNIVFEKEMREMMKGTYVDPDDNYKAVCLDKNPKATVCEKPVQIKTNIDSNDKSKLKKSMDTILDKKTGTVGFLKFLDWFVPIFLVGGAIAWIDHALSKEEQSLMDEIAREALEDTGMMKQLKTKDKLIVTEEDGSPIPPTGTNPIPTDTTNITNNVVDNRLISDSYIFGGDGSTVNKVTATSNFVSSVGVWVLDLAKQNNDNSLGITRLELKSDIGQQIIIGNGTAYNSNMYTNSSGIANSYVNDVVRMNDYNMNTSMTTDISLMNLKRVILYPTSIVSKASLNPRYRWTYLSYSYYTVTPLTLIANDGTIAQVYSTNGHNSLPSSVPYSSMTATVTTNALNLNQVGLALSYIGNGKVSELKDYVPTYNDIEITEPYTKEKVKVIPPTAVPITTPEGTPVTPDGEGGWKDVNTGEPVVVPNEDELIVGEPIVTPEGVEIPGGEIIPTPETEIPPDTETPPKDINEEDFEDLSCARPKKPDFKPIGESFTTAFPFSIPWDIKRMIDNAFGGVNDERPSFELSMFGDGVVIEIPSYFDKWVKFGKAIMVIGFDIGILFLFYRFMKGGGD